MLAIAPKPLGASSRTRYCENEPFSAPSVSAYSKNGSVRGSGLDAALGGLVERDHRHGRGGRLGLDSLVRGLTAGQARDGPVERAVEQPQVLAVVADLADEAIGGRVGGQVQRVARGHLGR